MVHFIEISDGTFVWYVFVRKPLASMKIALLSVRSCGQAHRLLFKGSAFSKKVSKCSFSTIISNGCDTVW